MLALAIIAAVLGLVVGSRVRFLGLVLTTTAMGLLSFLPVFHASPSPGRYVAAFAIAVAVHQLAAFAAMLIRYLTFRRPAREGSAPAYARAIKPEPRAPH